MLNKGVPMPTNLINELPIGDRSYKYKVVRDRINEVIRESNINSPVMDHLSYQEGTNEIVVDRLFSFLPEQFNSENAIKIGAWSYRDSLFPNNTNKLHVPQNFPNQIELFTSTTLEASTLPSVEQAGAFKFNKDDLVEITLSFKVDPQVSNNNYTIGVKSVSGNYFIRTASAATSRIDQGQTLNFIFPAFKINYDHAQDGVKLFLKDYDSTSNSTIYAIRTTMKSLGGTI